jgi:hypothetical protein
MTPTTANASGASPPMRCVVVLTVLCTNDSGPLVLMFSLRPPADLRAVWMRIKMRTMYLTASLATSERWG